MCISSAACSRTFVSATTTKSESSQWLHVNTSSRTIRAILILANGTKSSGKMKHTATTTTCAQVIRLYATEDDARKATEKRTSIPQRPGSDSSYSCSSNEVDGSFEEETQRQAAVKQKMKDVSSHFKKQQRDLLFGDAEGGKKTEKELLKEEVNMLKAENSKLLDRIRMLEKALCSKIFKTEKKPRSVRGLQPQARTTSCAFAIAMCCHGAAATHHHHAAAAHRYRAATAYHHSDPGQP
ncbi:uncharacterized protein LOC119402210 [Rhipicephalus sanguineus]|uniref:uncharacterized protein LOC119393569 n=1 Tax=Rhipicephalus sanguineus TaxID=34632 RepID=UPI001893EF10|nr:uncharacterized protein LOC119393569 [Rhipicephalus sanguineus]XP_037522128.1 uncharacterized protein LOC119399387 [Rhipicephalus sanguineus]XP_037523971.1 uncharacterized protein LOC119401330 [Rhipicephalus sanguineus]XP_037525268.1 uncharacterized protein LOC119402210 [Rhipicephalus sanguineus]